MFDYRSDVANLPLQFQDFRLTGGALPLNFIQTVHSWEGVCVDRVHDAAAWNSWLATAGQPVPTNDIDRVGLDDLRKLRESIFLIARSVSQGRDFDETALLVVNSFARMPAPTQQLVRTAEGRLAAQAPSPTHEDILAGIAREAVELFTGPLSGRIRVCAQPKCPTIFVDRSRSGTRKWCSTACSARAASRAYRSRLADHATHLHDEHADVRPESVRTH